MTDTNIKRSYYLFTLLHILPLSLVFTTYVIFLQENNMTSTQIGWIGAVFMITMFLFEIPTGIVADIFGRKASIVIGNILIIFGPVIYYCTDTFAWFVIAEASLGLGACFTSGAIDAWLKDSLDQNGNSHNLTDIMSNREIFFRVSLIIGGVTGSLIAIYDTRIVWLITAILQTIGSILVFVIIQEKYFKRQTITWKTAFTQIKNIAVDSFTFGIKNEKIFFLIIAFSIFSFACQPLNYLWAPSAKEHLGVASLSYLWIIMNIFMATGAVITKKISSKRFTDVKIMTIGTTVASLSIIIGSLFGNMIIIFSGLMINELGRGMYIPANNSFLQNNIPSSKRATISSFMSMMGKFGCAAGWLLAGIAHEYLSFTTIWVISGFFYLTVVVFLLKIKKT